MKSKLLTLSIIGVFTLSSFSNGVHLEMDDELLPGLSESYFPADILYSMMNRSECEAIRFYNTKADEMSPETLMAVCVFSGGDMEVGEDTNSMYQLYSGVNEEGAVITPMDRNNAKIGSQAIERGSMFAVTIPNHEIADLLSAEGATGIQLVESSDDEGNRTLTAYPAAISEGRITTVDGSTGYKSKSPCPNACGTNPSANYLNNMME